MTEVNRNRLQLSRLLAEGVVVVASILIAFALDAWWDDRQLAREMAEDLAIVDYELTENLRLVDLTIEIMENAIRAGKEIIAILEAHPDDVDVEIAGTALFWGVFNNPTLDPSFGGIDAWIASGRMAGIESPQLRQRLASVRGKVSDVTEEQHVARDLSIREIYPRLRDRISDIADIEQLYTQGFHARQGSGVQEIPDVGMVTIPNSNALRFSLRVRTLWYGASINEMNDFRKELEAIRALLRAEMGD